MALFGMGIKKRGRTPGKKSAPKTLKEILATAYTKELKKDPELMREIAFTDAGHADLLHRDRQLETQKKEIKNYIVGEALKQIKEDPDLAAQFVESQVEEILSNGATTSTKQGGRRGRRANREDNSEYDNSPISSISSALEGLDEIAELKSKLVQLGLVKEDGNGNGDGKAGGFMQGMTLKDILTALPVIQVLLGKDQQSVSKPTKVYVVPVNGQYRELTEPEYINLIKSGTLQINAPKKEELQGQQSSDGTIQPTVKSSPTTKQPELPSVGGTVDLPSFIKDINFDMITAWLDQEPQEFVLNLRAKVDEGHDESKFIWGFLSTVTYEGIVEKIMPYKDNPKLTILIERILSDDGKLWTEAVLELVSGFVEAKK